MIKTNVCEYLLNTVLKIIKFKISETEILSQTGVWLTPIPKPKPSGSPAVPWKRNVALILWEGIKYSKLQVHNKTYFLQPLTHRRPSRLGPEVIKLFFMLNLAEHELFSAKI